MGNSGNFDQQPDKTRTGRGRVVMGVRKSESNNGDLEGGKKFCTALKRMIRRFNTLDC